MSETTVLIIDDEKHLCELFADILAREDLPVQSANTAKDGLAILADPANEFGVVSQVERLPPATGVSDR